MTSPIPAIYLSQNERLINQILDAGRLDSERLDEKTKDVALADLLKACDDTVCLNYQVSASTMRWDVEPCMVRAKLVDRELIFRNLLTTR